MNTKTQDILSRQWVEAPQQAPPARIPYGTRLNDETLQEKARKRLEANKTAVMARTIAPNAKRLAALNLALANGTYDPYIADNIGTIRGLKLVEMVNGRMFGLYTPPGSVSTEYFIGRKYSELVGHNHGGGYYLYMTTNTAHFMKALENGIIMDPDFIHGNYGLLECEATGPYIFYGVDGGMLRKHEGSLAKKAASTSLTPLRLVYTFTR